MKLLITGSGSYKSGLTDVRAVPLSKSLSRLGWDVTMVVPSADKYNNFKADHKAKIDGIKLIQPWQFKTKSPFINLLPYMFTSLYKVLLNRPDILYMYKPSPANITNLLPMVVDFDDLGSEVMRQQNQPKFQVWLVEKCENLALRLADAVTVTSSYLEQSVKEKYPNKPILILSNGVDVEAFKQINISKPRPAVYYFGAINRLSLIENLLRSLPDTIRQVPGTQVIIMGGGQSLNEAKALVKELGVASSVEFTGWIKPEQIYDYIKFADIGVCTQPNNITVRAASNLKVFLYMAFGTVPVVSRVGDLPKYVGKTKADRAIGEIVSPDDTNELSQTLISLLKSPTRRKELSLGARVRAENIYSWDKLAVTLNEYLKTQINQPSLQSLSDEVNHA
jgi:glycosyltransferase involved in cell wall biosynthesis